MRRMRACATASAVFLGLFTAAAAFSACSSGPTPWTHPDTASTSARGPALPDNAPPAAPDGVDMQGPESNTPKAAPAAPAAPKKQPETVADCKQLASDITNEPPDGAVAMNNANTSADAGSSDRLQPMVDVIKAKRDGFRCCFDIYARKNPGAQGRVMLHLKLKPDGTVEEAGIKRDKSDVTAPEVESCMVDVVKSIAWPRSPSGKETVLSYPFDFKAHH